MAGLGVTYRFLTGLLLSALFIAACDSVLLRNDLEAITSRGELVLITRNNFACYYEAAHGAAGFEYELAKAFAGHLGVKLRPVVIEDEAQMVEALLHGKADLIAPGVPFGRTTARLVALGPGYLEVREQVVGRRGGPAVSGVKDLLQNPLWITGSSAGLEQLKLLQGAYADLSWRTLSEYSSEEMLQMVWSRSAPLTVVESNMVTLNRRFYPELVVHFNLGDPLQLRWAMNPQSRHLQRAVRKWFAAKGTQEIVNSLISHYYSHLEDFDYVDLVRYRSRIFDRLPKYQVYFEEAAQRYGLDWQLVAAQAYQESHWNPNARSFTGVKGIMMLTQDTAKTLGLKDRLSEREAIFAGTRYLARLHRLIGEEVPEPDRTLMALAAYNIGFGHLQDARALAHEIGKSSHSWSGVREAFPLLHKKKYYQKLPHGYARGAEAVQYVDRIRTYHKVLNMALAPEGLKSIGG
ncbi:MAG: membrane-bound lytic murein transglycosylase MltF [Desulfobacteraceae bacterium]|nr:MAG: membrane-bound lytic murein transglycosylase MltF [Desulfobacteraceae bacterium]